MSRPQVLLGNNCARYAAGQDPLGGGGTKQKSGGNVVRVKESVLRVCAFNANGINDFSKRECLMRELKDGCVDVCGVGETHLLGSGVWDGESEHDLWGGEGWVVWSGLDAGYKRKKKEGVAVILSERLRKCVKNYGCVDSRIVWCECKIGIDRYTFMCVYAPVNQETGKGAEENRKFWNKVNKCIRERQECTQVILVGDMNGRVGNEEIEGIVGKWGVEGRNMNGDFLLEVCAEREMFLANTFFEHRHIHRYTWHRGEGEQEQKSLIDYAMMDSGLKGRILDSKAVRGMLTGSDHYTVLTKVRIRKEWKYERKERKLTVERINVRKLNEECNATKYKDILKETIKDMDVMIDLGNTVDEVWKGTRDSMIKAAEKVCGKKTFKMWKKKGNAWFSKEIEEIVKKKKEFRKSMLQKNIPRETRDARKEEYKNLKQRVKRAIQDAKRKTDEAYGRKISEQFLNDRKAYYRAVKEARGKKTESVSGGRMRDMNGEVVEGDGVVKVWKDHFSSLAVKSRGKAKISSIGMERGRINRVVESQISREEVKEAINRLKMGKAAGVDNIPGEMLRYGGEEAVDIMHRLCKLAWEKESVPEDWRKAVIVPLYKGKGSKEECKNYRGISLLSIPGKVHARVVTQRLQKITDDKIGEEQGGFRKGRGCVDQIASMRLLVEKYLAKNRKLYAAFMDLEKAYDKVDWEGLWDVLTVYGVGGKLLMAVKSFYRNAMANVKVGDKLSESFEVNVGVRQGCVMSAWLFNIYMDGVIRECRAVSMGVGARLESEGRTWKILTCLYADDAVLLAENAEELQRVVTDFDRVCEKRKLKVNVGKCKVMVFERRMHETIDFKEKYRIKKEHKKSCKIKLKNEVLEEVESFKYLGAVLCKYGKMESEIKERKMQGRKVIGELDSILKGRMVSQEVKKSLRNSVLLPTLSYGSETWTASDEDLFKLRAVEMSFFRMAAGMNRLDGPSNREVYESFGMEEQALGIDCGVVEWIKRSTLRWYGHVQRMDEDRMPRKIYGSQVSGTASSGRPPMVWEKKVEKYIEEKLPRSGRGIVARAKEACLDKVAWRRFCHGHPLVGVSQGEARRRR